MKPDFLAKTSAAVTVLLFCMILTPILAFAAAGFTNIDYHSNGTVTGQVYFDSSEFGPGKMTVGNDVYVSIESPMDTQVTTTTATYSTYQNGYYYYNINGTVDSTTYNPIYLTWTRPSGGYSAVTNAVYKNSTGIASGGSSDTGGGGSTTSTGGSGSSTGSGVQAGSDGSIDATALQNLLQSNPNAEISTSGNFVNLPASALGEGKTLTVSFGDISYTLPLQALNLQNLATSLGVDLSQLTIQVKVEQVTDSTELAKMNAAATQQDTTMLVTPEQMTVTAQGGGKSENIESFGDTYVTRSFTLSQNSYTDQMTGAMYDPATGNFEFVPTTFSQTSDGNVLAQLKRTGNSIYTVVSVNKSFSDIGTHWAKSDILLLADKLLVNGTTRTTFAPDQNITRAEFAALITRALGLTRTAPAGDEFSDVSSGSWYAEDVGAAAAAGIVKGYPDGTFHPNADITRAELATMVVRALKYAGINTSLTAQQQNDALSPYLDASTLDWSKTYMAEAVHSGIVRGETASILAPMQNATRAESVVMIKRFLTETDFINTPAS